MAETRESGLEGLGVWDRSEEPVREAGEESQVEGKTVAPLKSRGRSAFPHSPLYLPGCPEGAGAELI